MNTSEFKSKLFRGGGFEWKEFAEDLNPLLSLGDSGLTAFAQFLNTEPIKDKLTISSFLQESLQKTPKDIRKIATVFSFLLEQFRDESHEELDNFVSDLASVSERPEEVLKPLGVFWGKLGPYFANLQKDNERDRFKNAYDYRFVSIGTNCKLKIQFEEDISIFTDAKEYDADKDLKDIIPVADVYIKVKHKKDEKEFTFQVDASDLDLMIKYLSLTKTQLESVTKLVKIVRG